MLKTYGPRYFEYIKVLFMFSLHDSCLVCHVTDCCMSTIVMLTYFSVAGWSLFLYDAINKSLSNVILMDENFTSFHQCLRYCHKCGIFVIWIPGTILEPNLTFLEWFLPEIAYLSMLFILEVVCTAGSAEHLKNK